MTTPKTTPSATPGTKRTSICTYPRCECMCHPDDCVFKPENQRHIDPLLDRDCVMLDGKCDCPRITPNSFPDCRKYGDSKGPDLGQALVVKYPFLKGYFK